jgi:hypothetical protein
MPPGSNNGPSIGGDGGDGGDAVGGNAISGDGGDAVGGNAIGGDGGDAVGGNAIGGDGGDGGDAVGLALTEPICDDTAIAGAGRNGGDTFNGIQGNDGESGTDEIAIC